MDRRLLVQTLPVATDTVTEELPLRVVPDWDDQLRRANEVCRLIDRHLDYEARGRLLLELEDFRPQHLCPEQRVQMCSDLYSATR
ncbi:MAG: hypothetical protein ACO1SX_15965 [Actinomycetota bacterium]